MFRASRAKIVALASVGSGSVSFGIAETSAAPKWLARERRELPLEKRDDAQTIASLKRLLMEAGQKALAASPQKNIEALYCVLRAPWTQTKIGSVEKNFDEPAHITERIMAELARQAVGQMGGAKYFLEASVARVALDGYAVKHPEGKRAKRIELSALVAAGDPAMRAAAQEALAALLPAHQPIVRSGTRALSAAIAQSGRGGDCLALDVSREGTSILVMRDGIAEESAYLEEGVRSIMQRAAPNAAPEAGYAALSMMARDECSEEACLAIQQGFAAMEPELAHAFGEAFAALSAGRRLPTQTSLLSEPALLPWLVKFFSRIDFTQFTEIAQPLSPAALALPGVAKDKDADLDLEVALALINKEASGE